VRYADDFILSFIGPKGTPGLKNPRNEVN